MISQRVVAALGGLAASLPGALAGFNPSATDNIAIYWGQNSVNKQGGQLRLAEYCADSPINIIPLAFLNVIKNPTTVNFASASDNCTAFPDSQLLRCPQIEEDIQICQSLNKSILLSIGGATYTEGGFASAEEAQTWAATIWAMFGPAPPGFTDDSDSDVLRPFGNATVDGFDMDLEASSAHMAEFAGALRSNMDGSDAGKAGRKFLLSAAPQCPFPDAAMGEMLDAGGFDYVGVQFYNNYCAASAYQSGDQEPGQYNFETWDEWAKNVTTNPGIKVLVGLPGSSTAAGMGYVEGEQLQQMLAYSKKFESFGGVMSWDMSQVYANQGWLDSVVSALLG
ncbi:uncharacterized protein C8A04DRAFT_10171 [Dichotomopilus funicola]|uniref:chitinase n=1 Tax=Dichotomopilus funicola TaxID=1934379 RepID=A0AAN6ZQ58_9PEZI|nr:hypothetical protein C8A04DRAFT_10171 [Dichotomopilus funicola]